MPTVLIVDDSQMMRMILKDCLYKAGYTNITEAENGLRALEKINESIPDIVILDINMPELDGLETLKKLRAGGCHSKVIMCSAAGTTDKMNKAKALGASKFIVKPFTKEKLISAVSSTIN